MLAEEQSGIHCTVCHEDTHRCQCMDCDCTPTEQETRDDLQGRYCERCGGTVKE